MLVKRFGKIRLATVGRSMGTGSAAPRQRKGPLAMPELPAPTASRLRKPSWRDGRLLVGVLLVLLSAMVGSLALARADDRVPVYAAKGPLLPGEALTADRVGRVDVQLGDATAAYLSAASSLPLDRYVLREVRQG